MENKKGTAYGYCRISTKQQFKEKTHLKQMESLINEGIKKKNIFFDNVSGKSLDNRDELNRLLETVTEGDTITVVNLSRLARNTADALHLAEKLTKQGVALNILNMGRFDNSANGKLLFTILSAFAEFDREQINEKLQSARQWHRENVSGYKDGRKKKLTRKEQNLLYKRYQSKEETAQEIAESYNISRKTLYNYIKELEQDEENKFVHT